MNKMEIWSLIVVCKRALTRAGAALSDQSMSAQERRHLVDHEVGLVVTHLGKLRTFYAAMREADDAASDGLNAAAIILDKAIAKACAIYGNPSPEQMCEQCGDDMDDLADMVGQVGRRCVTNGCGKDAVVEVYMPGLPHVAMCEACVDRTTFVMGDLCRYLHTDPLPGFAKIEIKELEDERG